MGSLGIVIVIVNVKVPVWVRTPAMLPTTELRTSPGGNSPRLNKKLFGACSPLTDSI
jgi:hypothetical protein